MLRPPHREWLLLRHVPGRSKVRTDFHCLLHLAQLSVLNIVFSGRVDIIRDDLCLCEKVSRYRSYSEG